MGEFGLFVAFSALSWYYMIGIFIFSLVFIVLAFYENFTSTLVVLFLLFGIVQYTNLYDFTTIDIISLLYIFIIYILIGIIWSLFKYKFEVSNIVLKIKKRNKDVLANDLKSSILETINYQITKDRISSWIVFFPISIIKFLFEDMVIYVIERMGKVYNKIAEIVIDNELKK